MILYSDSNVSKFTDAADNLNLWPAVKCGLSGTWFLGQQEQLLSWKQIDTFTADMRGRFFFLKWLLHALLDTSYVS